MRTYLNDDWFFTNEFSEKLLEKGFPAELEQVRIPHSVKETPLHYFDEKEYQMISGYKRILKVDSSQMGKRLLLTFEGVAHRAVVYVNGQEAGEHNCGYTAFTVDISDLVNEGDNEITVMCDSNENLNVPPFGFVIDYMTYGGIYRDVYLEVKEQSYIKDVFVYSRLSEKYNDRLEDGSKVTRCKRSNAVTEIEVSGDIEGLKIRQYIRQKSGLGKTEKSSEYKALKTVDLKAANQKIVSVTGDVELWDISNTALYEIKTQLIKEDKVLDETVNTLGFRQAVFRTDGFFLNGRKVKLRGLNRHQSYAYTGYAMPKSMQVFDADILKNELGLNAVRTSHYPQSQYFIERCDEIGLLVFTEMPGWQHIGDESWKEQAITNLREMIVQYRNHPSIILWGVRINESVDDDEFYTRTNELARELDPSRQTGGVRCYKKGSFLEDVYTYNDFSHVGTNLGVEKKAEITSDVKKPYFVSEYNGHMFPTKSYDWEEHRLEHMLRHANVLDEVIHQTDIAGSFGWCMFDYNTHQDFGSGDRICYHGVMDMFRNPKLAASVYSCFNEDEPILMLSSTMDIGEHPGSNRGKIYILTNLDTVRMYKNDVLLKEYHPEDSEYKHLPHGPILVDDYIGDALTENENMPKRQATAVKQLLNATAGVGLYNLSKPMWLKAGKLMLRYGMKMEDAVQLYNKYIGDWGGSSKLYTLKGYKDGELVKTVNIGPMSEKKLVSQASSTVLSEVNSYDVAAIRMKAVDEYGNVLPFANDPVILSTEGDIEIIGPKVTALSGGMGGTYIKTKGVKGHAKLIMSMTDGVKSEIEFEIV